MTRNNFFFKNDPINSAQTAKLTLGKAPEFLSNLNLNENPSRENPFSNQPPPINTNPLVWKPPDTFWFKLNCDGSMLNSLMGACGCLRDASCNWLVGISKFIGIGDTLQAELWAILLGLKLASQPPHISKIVIETYSTQAVEC